MSGKAGSGGPPADKRFRKGQSGNPKGRPKGTTSKRRASAFDDIIGRTLSVTLTGSQGGVKRQLTVEEALQHKTLQKAFAGDRAARREVLRMIEKRERALAKGNDSVSEPKGLRFDSANPRNAEEALLILGIASPMPADPSYLDGELQLERWAVEAALSRRRGGSRLTDTDISEIKEHTCDPESLQWPRGTKA
jgi:Family of unknown function (DUF5681)